MTLDLKGLCTIMRTKRLLWDRNNRYPAEYNSPRQGAGEPDSAGTEGECGVRLGFHLI